MWKRIWARIHPLGAPRLRRVAAVLLAMIAGGWLGLLAGGHVTTDVGPVQAGLSVRPWPTGDTVVHTPPLGSVTFDTHDGPLRMEASVQRIRPQAAQRIVRKPESLNGLTNRVTADLRTGITWLAIKASASAIAGAGMFALVVYWRRWWLVGTSALAAGGFLAASALAGYLTFDPRSIEEPRYTGLLTSAPRIVGNVANLAENFSQYRQELAKLITNVSRVYTATSNLNVYEPNPSTIRVLHVSDLHLNPAAWSLMHSVVQQFKINVIVDTGDIVDAGTSAESRYVEEISTFDVPYVYVRGNHDSQITQQAVADQPNSVVLNGTVKEVAGLRVFGAGDPRFRPDRGTGTQPNQQLYEVGQEFAKRVRKLDQPADFAVFHDPVVGKALDGTVPIILAGHRHERSTRILPHGSRLMIDGSTGGAGIRAFDLEKPTPIQMSVLYIDRETHRLQAWDGITLGGLGSSSAEINRHIATKPNRTITPPPTQSPTPTTSPTGSPAGTAPADGTTGSPRGAGAVVRPATTRAPP